MRDLLITLGHNASVVAIEDGHVLNAYESERLTGVKSDSRFAVEALARVADFENGGTKFDRAFVGHWAPYNNVDDMKEKYWDRAALEHFAKKIIPQENLGLSHHDAHAHAAIAFAGQDFPEFDSGVLVIDGFGSFGEHMSYYRLIGGQPTLMRRAFGYETSLGLMYQYATAYLGMKMHEDEYKLLGYAARVEEVGMSLSDLDEIAFRQLRQWQNKLREVPQTGISLDELPQVQALWAKTFDTMLDQSGYKGDPKSEDARRVLGYLVQRLLELCVHNFVSTSISLPGNLIFTGGVGYNVALNRMLLKLIRGKLCVFPLAGDQGNGFGLARVAGHKPIDFGDLCWGQRRGTSQLADGNLPDGLLVFDGRDDVAEVVRMIKESLEGEGFVNLVRGRMEYGPRALCNTTTLALATNPDVAAEINRINGRNSVMPFAPVVWNEHLLRVFPDAARLHKSERFMICATDYSESYAHKFPGASLTTANGFITGRAQSYSRKGEQDPVADVLVDYGLLINTSFNVHGVPICCDLKDVIHSHQYQRNLNPKVRTIFIEE